MREREKERAEERVTAAFTAFSQFLSQTCCGRCEVLEICLKRVQEDVRAHRAAYPKALLSALRRTVPFSVSHAPAGCSRCVPAEILMLYLTPGGRNPDGEKRDETVE